MLRLVARASLLVAGAALAIAAPVSANAAVTANPAPSHVATASGDTNSPISVDLKIKGPHEFINVHNLRTSGHTVTTASGGTHKCDGTNNGAHSSPGAAPTAALDDASHDLGFTWDGPFYTQFHDYLVTKIAQDTANSSNFWQIAVNGTPIPVGGCQFRLHPGDNVAFTYTATNN
jgi:hypothetical protein